MITPPVSRPKGAEPSVSFWHKDVGEILSRDKGVPLKEAALFCSKLAFLLGAGVSVNDALRVIGEQCEGRMARVLPQVHTRILQGEGLSQALAATRAFPVFMCGFMRVGEMTATLPKVCEQLSAYFERQERVRAEAVSALMYPAAVTLMMLGVIIMAVAVVLPGYAQMFAAQDVALPALTRGLLAASAAVTRHGAVILAGAAAAIIAVSFFIRSGRGRGRAFLAWAQMKFYLYRLNVNIQLARVCELMLGAGQPLSAAVDMCAHISGNERVRRDFKRVEGALAAGSAFWMALGEVEYIEGTMVGMCRVGEDSGRLSATMAACCAHLEEEYSCRLRRLSKLVEPIITLVLGVVMALVMLAIVLPTFELATAI